VCVYWGVCVCVCRVTRLFASINVYVVRMRARGRECMWCVWESERERVCMCESVCGGATCEHVMKRRCHRHAHTLQPRCNNILQHPNRCMHTHTVSDMQVSSHVAHCVCVHTSIRVLQCGCSVCKVKYHNIFASPLHTSEAVKRRYYLYPHMRQPHCNNALQHANMCPYTRSERHANTK